MAEPVPSARMIAGVREIAALGAAEALKGFRQTLDMENKAAGGAFDPVTSWDRAAEQLMRARIHADFSDHGILGEEFGEKSSPGPWRWVLDPIDGTRGYVAGTPTWTTLVGLEHEGVPVVGAIVQPFTGEVWHGFPGGATYVRSGVQSECSTSSCSRLKDARLATTDPRPHPGGPMSPQEATRFLELARRCPVARFGLDAYGYGLLALGHMDLVVESGLQRYDVSAVLPVLRGAGVLVTGWDGEPSPHEGGRVLAAATPELHAAARDVLGHLGTDA